MTALPNPCVIVPVYNHSACLRQLIDCLSGMQLPVILVDDGSHQACKQVISELAEEFSGLTLGAHEKNAGKGAAVKTALRLAEQAGYSHAIQVDADGQHNLNDIPRFLQAMHQKPEALITGYPVYDNSIPKHRYYGRYASHIWVWINTLSTEIVDSMCGFRVYPIKSSNRLLHSGAVGDRMDFDGEFVVRWFWRGWPLLQLETRVVYPDNGVSHFRLFNDNVLISWMHARLFFGMLCRLPMLLFRKFRCRRVN